MNKNCSKCNINKPLSEFNTRPDRPSGYRSECKQCQYKTQYLNRGWRRIPLDRWRCYNKLKYAIKTGKVVKSDSCDFCGKTVSIEAHHPDYNKPLKVQWVCVPCHHQLHKKKTG